MSKITISCTNVKCYNYGVPVKIEKEDPEYFKDGIYICPKCGQVIEVEEKTSKAMDPMMRKRILVGFAALIVIAGIVCGIIFGTKSIRNKAEQRRIAAIEQTAEAARLEAEAAAAAESARQAEEQAKQAKKQSTATGSIDYGKWSGAWKNGKPHGTGTMRYTKEHLIDSRDPQKRTAVKGDYIIGEFANGKLVQGVWYDSANNVKGSIIIGM